MYVSQWSVSWPNTRLPSVQPWPPWTQWCGAANAPVGLPSSQLLLRVLPVDKEREADGSLKAVRFSAEDISLLVYELVNGEEVIVCMVSNAKTQSSQC
jgi:hypothetical protein